MDSDVDLAAARARAEELQARFDRLREGYADLQRTVLAVRGTATSDDGLVTVTVGPNGQLVDLELSPRIYRRPDARRLAETIVETVMAAAGEAAGKVAEAFRPFAADEEEVRQHLDLDAGGVVGRLHDQLDRSEGS